MPIQKLAKLLFDEWMQKVNDICWERYGLSADDLPDVPYYDWYDEGVTPGGAATRAYKNAGG